MPQAGFSCGRCDEAVSTVPSKFYCFYVKLMPFSEIFFQLKYTQLILICKYIIVFTMLKGAVS